MTAIVDDPLIAGMAIARELPLHESSRRLRQLYPECPRVYGVAVMSDLTRRRWWPLQEALSTDRLAEMFGIGALEMDSPVAAAQQLAATLAHVVIGRVLPLLVLEGRAWDTGVETYGSMSIRRVRSIGWVWSIRHCERCPTTCFSAHGRSGPLISRGTAWFACRARLR